MELTVLIPTLNEAGSIESMLAQLHKAASTVTDSYEILVVDGGSSDNTIDLAGKGGARVIRQGGHGFGAALREGFQAARGKYILAMDGDGSHPPEILRLFWERRSEQDLLIASRYMFGGSASMPWFRYVSSWSLNRIMRWLLRFPVYDSSSGFRLYRSDGVRNLKLHSTDFSIQQEILLHMLRAGRSVAEMPFHYARRLAGRSKACFTRLALGYLGMLFRLRSLWVFGIIGRF